VTDSIVCFNDILLTGKQTAASCLETHGNPVGCVFSVWPLGGGVEPHSDINNDALLQRSAPLVGLYGYAEHQASRCQSGTISHFI